MRKECQIVTTPEPKEERIVKLYNGKVATISYLTNLMDYTDEIKELLRQARQSVWLEMDDYRYDEKSYNQRKKLLSDIDKILE